MIKPPVASAAAAVSAAMGRASSVCRVWRGAPAAAAATNVGGGERDLLWGALFKRQRFQGRSRLQS